MTVKERLILFLKHKKLSQAKFAGIIDVSTGYVNSIRKSIQPDKINTIAVCFPDLNTGWLMTGEGSMLKDGRDETLKSDKLIIYAPIISQYSYSEYLDKYIDDCYIQSLPTIPMFFDKQPEGIYRAFEAQGDSMNDNSIESIKEGDTLLSREINKEFWKYKFMSNWVYVIVHKTEGVLVRKITDHEVEKEIIKTHPLNPFYKNLDIDLKEVFQLFNVVQIQRKV